MVRMFSIGVSTARSQPCSKHVAAAFAAFVETCQGRLGHHLGVRQQGVGGIQIAEQTDRIADRLLRDGGIYGVIEAEGGRRQLCDHRKDLCRIPADVHDGRHTDLMNRVDHTFRVRSDEGLEVARRQEIPRRGWIADEEAIDVQLRVELQVLEDDLRRVVEQLMRLLGML